MQISSFHHLQFLTPGLVKPLYIDSVNFCMDFFPFDTIPPHGKDLTVLFTAIVSNFPTSLKFFLG